MKDMHQASTHSHTVKHIYICYIGFSFTRTSQYSFRKCLQFFPHIHKHSYAHRSERASHIKYENHHCIATKRFFPKKVRRATVPRTTSDKPTKAPQAGGQYDAPTADNSISIQSELTPMYARTSVLLLLLVCV